MDDMEPAIFCENVLSDKGVILIQMTESHGRCQILAINKLQPAFVEFYWLFMWSVFAFCVCIVFMHSFEINLKGIFSVKMVLLKLKIEICSIHQQGHKPDTFSPPQPSCVITIVNPFQPEII